MLNLCFNLCFHVLPEQAASVQILHGISFLLQFRLELQFELATNRTEVSAALHTGHSSRVKNVFLIKLAHKHIVKMMPMFRLWMHPGCCDAIFLMKDCVGNGESALSAELEQEAPIVITFTNAMPTKDSFPGQ